MRKLIVPIFLIITVVITWRAFAPWSVQLVPPDLAYPDGSYYYGALVNGRAEGKGEWIAANGARYQGLFQQGLFHGSGDYWEPNGIHFKGEFKAGLKSGLGQIRWPSGDQYSGEFSLGMRHGFGTLKLVNGDEYQGQFEQDLMSGHGVYRTRYGDSFTGLFAKGEIYKGIHEDAEGNRYTGGFKHWRYHGEGEYLTNDNTLYRGQFEDGVLQGKGEVITGDGSRYLGELVDWAFHGRGIFHEASGAKYVGQFEYGYYHGKGMLTLAEPVNGQQELRGDWQYGSLRNDPRIESKEKMAATAEAALYQQTELLAQSFDRVALQQPDTIDLYVIAVAGYSAQAVFKKEVQVVSDWFQQSGIAQQGIISLVNHSDTVRNRPLATLTSIEKSIQHVASTMDLNEDILFLYLTSHGSEDHRFSIQMDGIKLNDLTPEKLKAMLDQSGIKWKVIMISACYSGGFIPALADDYSLVMTAARKDRTSFGCSDDSDMTYFGKAYFSEALPASSSFIKAFYAAEELVGVWEARDFPDSERSEPQIHIGSAMEKHLTLWRQN